MQLATEHVLFYPAGLLLTVPFSAPASAPDRPALIPSRYALPKKTQAQLPPACPWNGPALSAPFLFRFFLL
jgi:hypothetical protein